MKGLILKDFMNLKKYSKSLGLILLMFLGFGFLSKDFSFLIAMVQILFAMMTIVTFSYDDIAKWDRYLLTMPIKRNEVVLSKYLLALILVVVSFVLSLFVSFISGYITKVPFTSEKFVQTGVICLLGIVLVSCLIPLTFKFGVEKSRLFIIAIAFIPTILIVGLKNLGVNPPTDEQIVLLVKLSPVIVLLLLIASYFISCAIYNKKEI